MELNIDDIESSAHQNLIDYIRNDQTRTKYIRDLQKFLDLVPTKIYEENNITFTDKTEAFVILTKRDVIVSKNIIKAYVRELKKKIENNELSTARVLNLIKPIKALFAANDIDFSWKKIDKAIPKPTKSKDKAYTREQLQALMENATNLIDKVMITLCSSAGFRVEAWDYFTWEDVIFFYNDDDSLKGGALRVYRGDDEEYWTHFTPEAAKYLILYRESWKSRFMKYPKETDPLISSARGQFPVRLRKKGMESRMNELAKNTGLRPPLQEGQKRHKVMLDHGLRKYCNTMLRRAKVNFADKEDLQGRSPGGQESSYERYEEKDFERFEEYQKAIPLLTISDEERTALKLKIFEEKESSIDQFKETISDLTQRLTNAESNLQNLSKENKRLEHSEPE